MNNQKKAWIPFIILIAWLPFFIAAWDNDLPADSDAWNTAAGSIRANWDALEVELGINLAEAHPYYQAAAPSKKPDTTTALDVDDNGRLWIDSDDNRVYILTDYSGQTWTEAHPGVANNTYFTAVDAAGTGTVDLIKANASDVAVIPDGSELATSGAPTADADIANKKYVDDQIAAYIASEVSLSAYTNEDSENNAMVKDHAYKAATDGEVSVYVLLSGGTGDLRVYVGSTNDPAGAGDLIDRCYLQLVGNNSCVSVKALVAKDEYFEITVATTSGTPVIQWKSFGTLSKPIDNN